MKILKILIKISAILLLYSCSVSEKDWHESARKVGAQSIYVHKDGTKTTGEEWYKSHPLEEMEFRAKYGNRKKSESSSQTFIAAE